MPDKRMTLERAMQIGDRPSHYSAENKIAAWDYLDGYSDKYGLGGRSRYLELARRLEDSISRWPLPSLETPRG